jgi:hypothetical protein
MPGELVGEVRLVLVLAAMFLAPGWALLAVSGSWPTWPGLQRWIVAVGLSIAVYPLLFYGLRFLLPSLTLGPYKMGALLVACAGLAAWALRGRWREQLRFDWLEWAAIVVVAVTLFTRLGVAHWQPYPASGDSLHHVLMTELTARQGGLPTTLAPYFPIPLAMYHLGLHATAAVTAWLAQVPFHTALLWTAQVFNGLCGLGVYLVLDRKAGRAGAVVGLVVVGLLSYQPAWYVNWGRFTQLASQALLLIAWCVTYDAIVAWPERWRTQRAGLMWSTFFAAALTAAVFLLHFRVAAFYLLCLAPSLVYALWRLRRRQAELRLAMAGTAVIGTVALLLVLPVLWGALGAYIADYQELDTQTVVDQAQVAEVMEGYFAFDWRNGLMLAARPWLLALATICLLFGLAHRNRVSLFAATWTALLLLLGNTYALGVSMLNVTNMGAVLIMLYLPMGLAIGAAVEALLSLVDAPRRGLVAALIVGIALGAGLARAEQRMRDLEPYRYYVTSNDIEAMGWIREHLPEDAYFAVNTNFWLPTSPYGTDAGYWIPYFTGRRMTAGVAVLSLADYAYRSEVVAASRAAKALETDLSAIDDLIEMGIHYIYIGEKGNFERAGLNADFLLRSGRAHLLYRNGNVAILQLGGS